MVNVAVTNSAGEWLHGEIVDEPGPSHPRRREQPRRPIERLDRRQRFRVAQNDIVDRGEAAFGEPLPRGRERLGNLAAALDRARRLAERARQHAGGAALLVREIGVARREGEAVRVPLRRHPDDLDREAEFPRHLPDDEELLVILLAEYGHVRLHLLEQARHHRRHAVEMAGPRGAIQHAAELARAHRYLGPIRVHGGRVGSPQQGAARLVEHLRVARLAPRIGGKILIGSELGGIDEDRGDDVRRAPLRLGDEGHVAGVKGAHRRDERHRAAVGAQRRHRFAQRVDVTDRLHRLLASGRAWGRPLAGGDSQNQEGRNRDMGPHFIVFANEKGGTGKSTTAVHSAVALAAAGRRVAALDLDTRQRTLGRYLDNRAETIKRLGVELPMPAYETFDPEKGELGAAIDRLAGQADIVVVDTPGRDDPHARAAMIRADTLVTPINDSFVDLDLIGQVDAETYRVRRPSFYAELVWNSRTQRAKSHGASVDWVVLRNRMQHIEARNMRRVGEALGELSRRVGFRVIPGLGERVIYRELFPKGLTLLDLAQLGEVGIAHIAARQELREMIAGFQLPQEGQSAAPQPAAAAG